MNRPLISIISVHFNGLSVTEAFIQSILRIAYAPVEIIVVDNGSLHEPIAPLIEKYPSVKFIISEENLGFAGGNNLGIKEANGEYFLFINNDTEVPEGFLEPLVSHFIHNERVGMASPVIKYFGTDVIQYAGSGAINHYTGRSVRKGFEEVDKGQYDYSFPTEMIHGAAVMVRRKVIEEIGMMPELFFLYYEELDWCAQAKKAGYEIWVVGQSKVFHKESMSVGRESPFKLYYMTRNRILYLRRNTRNFQKLSWILFFIFFTIPKSTLLYLVKGNVANLKSFYKGLLWHFRNNLKEAGTKRHSISNY
ncbi:glycosyltransferase family 2 protein [Marivirga sp. S37H4]|uniref:Glycosyltransferase family 2 protein n=2 Tax=Marivirga aurantiaca TaxID=2802615 RepID=A0A934X103_9BACT|nr:glycosyltransferase family 2 protein [Marivirga aurantiaca]